MNIVELFHKGGPVMYPLLLCSLAALTIIIERFFNLRKPRMIKPSVADTVDELVISGVYGKAEEICEKNPSAYTNIVKALLENRSLPREELKEIIVESGRHELPYLTRYLPTLSTITGISPLLGLLGTVLGMIKIFNVIAQMGTGTAAALSVGIGEALITTVTGLSIAIPSLVFYNYFSRRADDIINEIEKRTMRLVRAIAEKISQGQ